MRLDTNFNDVPDQMTSVSAGQYKTIIEEMPEIKESKSKKGNNLSVKFKITSDGPFKDRPLYTAIPTWMEMGLIQIKRLCNSSGVLVGAEGLELSDLVGTEQEVIVESRIFNDPQTGEQKEQASVKDFIQPVTSEE